MRKLVKIKAKDLKPNPHQVRKPRTEAELRSLGESVMKHQEVPLIVDSTNMILDGHGRCGGVMLINPAFELECIQSDENLDSSEVQLITAMQKNLAPYEKYKAMRQWKQAHPGAMDAALADRMGITPGMVSKTLSLSKCLPAWHEAAEAGRVGISDWVAASQLDEKGQHELLAMKLNGSSRDKLEAAGRKRRNGTKPAVRLSRVKIPFGGATLILSGKDLDMSAIVELLAECLKEARKVAETYDVKTWMRMMADKAKAERGYQNAMNPSWTGQRSARRRTL
jgi:ParB family chromosome partitioning protein